MEVMELKQREIEVAFSFGSTREEQSNLQNMLELVQLPETLTIYRLPVDLDAFMREFIPADTSFYSITRTRDEISMILPSDAAFPPANIRLDPEVIKKEEGWSYFRVKGTLDFGLTGIVSKLTAPLADRGVSVFVVSTFDTDYMLVKSTKAQDATDAWNALEGVRVSF